MVNNITLSLASINDINAVLTLHSLYQIDSINKNDKADGFITTAFTEAHLKRLITHEAGLFIAKQDNKIVAYAMAASWAYWSAWPIFAHMIKTLPTLTYQGQTLSMENCYQYGPVCVDKAVRGEGIFEKIFEFALQAMSQRYPILITFINKQNPRSYAAHVNKVNLELIQSFEINNQKYYQLACLSRRQTKR